MSNINSVNQGSNKYCGPAVLSILTGRNTDDCAYAISRVTGKYEVKAVEIGHLLKAADILGFDSLLVDTGSTLYGTAVKLAHSDGIYIVMVPRHVVVVEILEGKVFLCDNHTKEPIQGASSARLGQRVLSAYKVFKKPPKPIPQLLDTQLVIEKYPSHEGTFYVKVSRSYSYDMPEANRTEKIADFTLRNEDELRMLIEGITK